MRDRKSNVNMAAALVTLVALMLSKVCSDITYNAHHEQERGYQVEVSDNAVDASQEPEKNIDIASLIKSAQENIADLAKKVDIDKLNSKLIKKCQACHNLNKGDPHKIGPHLWNISGSDKARFADFQYSKAIKAKGGKWTDEDLFHLINNPKKFIPGTRMSFAGIKKPEDIASLVVYLKSLSDK